MILTSLLATTAFAHSDLTTTITPPVGAYVYDTARVNIAVANIGNKSALGTVLTIQLPVTATTPVLVMGTVIAKDARCVTSGTKLVCTLGTRAKGTTTTVWYDMSYPEKEGLLTVSATATTTSLQNSLANDSDSENLTLLNDVVTVIGGDVAFIEHCTGTNLTAYFECECFPSSISDHEHIFNGDGTISIPVAPYYTGTWSQPTPDSLVFDYSAYGLVEVEFVGYGVSANCFEGMATFPSSPYAYVSPYSVCL